jgi:hypothetical protein
MLNEQRCDHASSGTLAIRSGHMNDWEGLLRVSEDANKAPHVIER